MGAALAVKLPELFGLELFGDDSSFYARNRSLFVLPFLTGYFAWRRRMDAASVGWVGLAFASAAVLTNLFPFTPAGSTEILTALHLPIALWLAVGVVYTGGAWSQGGGRMDFVRFSGERFIDYVRIAFGGIILTGFTLAMIESIGLDVEWLAQTWLLPYGALGAVIVGAWLVEAKQSVIENMAPVLTSLFTPLFAAVLLAFLTTVVWTGSGIDVEREVLIGFDLLLALVLGATLCSLRARPTRGPQRLRCPPVAAGRERARCQRSLAGCDRGTYLRVLLQPQQVRCTGRKRHPARQPFLVGVALRALRHRTRPVRRTGAMANGLPPYLCGVGSRRRRAFPAAIRLRLTGTTTQAEPAECPQQRRSQ